MAHANSGIRPLAYSIAATCKATSCGRSLIYDLIKQNRLKTIKAGRRTLVTAKSLEEFIEGGAA